MTHSCYVSGKSCYYSLAPPPFMLSHVLQPVVVCCLGGGADPHWLVVSLLPCLSSLAFGDSCVCNLRTIRFLFAWRKYQSFYNRLKLLCFFVFFAPFIMKICVFCQFCRSFPSDRPNHALLFLARHKCQISAIFFFRTKYEPQPKYSNLLSFFTLACRLLFSGLECSEKNHAPR